MEKLFYYDKYLNLFLNWEVPEINLMKIRKIKPITSCMKLHNLFFRSSGNPNADIDAAD